MSTVNEMLTAAIAARKDTLRALRGRIADLLEPIPVGVVLSDEVGEVCRIVRICTGASQWANRTWDVTIKGTGAISDGALVCEVDLDQSYWDGNNMHHRKSEPTCLYTANTDSPLWGEQEYAGLKFVPGEALRALAERLPTAIERYMAKCEAEAALNAATLK